jgi:hypothetical protein
VDLKPPVARDRDRSSSAPALAHVPRGYPLDHSRAELLRHRGLTVHRRHDLGSWRHKPRAGKIIRHELGAATALVRWLREHVGAAQRDAARAG